MLADAAKHAFDALIVWKTDRIGRNKEEITLNKYHLKKNGVKIYYVAETILDTPEGIILEAVICSAKKKKLCTKRAVRQCWIENLVIEHVVKLVQNEELLEFIAERTYQYYLAQNTDTSYTKSLQKALAETEKAISNLMRAIEAGIFNETTKNRMDELEAQKFDLRISLAAAKLKEDLGLKKEHIVYFLHQFTEMDYTDLECQKRLIKTFVNAVYVYEDKVVLTFNYSGDNRTITLKEIDAGLQQGVRIPRACAHQKPHTASAVWGFCR